VRGVFETSGDMLQPFSSCFSLRDFLLSTSVVLRFAMRFSLLVLSLVSSCVAQLSLQDYLANNTEVSAFNALLSQSKETAAILESASNFTLLIPSNAAIATLQDVDLLQLLYYHLLTGEHAVASITNVSQFIPTHLTNVTFANVTGGQVVEALQENNKTTFRSWLQAAVNVTDPVRYRDRILYREG
jgi:Fasciclin domain